jgi:hypothetical protein
MKKFVYHSEDLLEMDLADFVSSARERGWSMEQQVELLMKLNVQYNAAVARDKENS